MTQTLRYENAKRKSYFAREILILKFCGISFTGNDRLAYKIFSFIARYWLISYPIVYFRDLNKHGFNVFAQALPIWLASLLACVASITSHKYRVKLGKFIHKLEKEPFLSNQRRGGDTEDKLVKEWELAHNRQSLTVHVISTTSFIFGFLYTLVRRIRSSDPKEWINSFAYGPLTVLDVTRSPNYELSVLYQNIAIFLISASLCAVVIMLAGILAYISVQFKMLQNNLRTVTKYCYQELTEVNKISQNTLNTQLKAPWTHLETALKEVVCYHSSILEVVSEVDAIFSMFMLSLYFTIVCILCFVMYASSVIPASDPHIVSVLLQTVGAMALPLIVCYWGEQVAYESEQVGLAAYESHFIGKDLRFQKALNLIVIRSQRTARIKAGKLVDTSMATYGWIIRNSVSYFMITRSVNTKQH